MARKPKPEIAEGFGPAAQPPAPREAEVLAAAPASEAAPLAAADTGEPYPVTPPPVTGGVSDAPDPGEWPWPGQALHVTGPARGRWRAGFFFTPEPTVFAEGCGKFGKFALFLADPELVVTLEPAA